MKTKELILKLKQEHPELFRSFGGQFELEDFQMSGLELKSIISVLKECDEFRNVKQINVVAGPNFEADLKGNPVEIESTKYAGGKTQALSTCLYKFDDEHDNTEKLSEEIDIWAINLTPVRYPSNLYETLENGVWLMPLQFDKQFDPSKSIVIKWNPEQLQDLATKLNVKDLNDTIKKNILEKVENFLSSHYNESNVSGTRSLIMRLSARSIKQQETVTNQTETIIN